MVSMTKLLPGGNMYQRQVFDPVNPCRIIYTKPVHGAAVEDDSQMDTIIHSILIGAGSDCKTRLRHEASQARTSLPLTIRTSDDKVDCCFLYFFIVTLLTICLYIYLTM